MAQRHKGVPSMVKKVYVNLPALPNVEKIVLLDQREKIFINLSCKGKGEIRIVPATPNEKLNKNKPS